MPEAPGNNWIELDLEENIDRVDSLFKRQRPQGGDELAFALGMRLALGMALEIKKAVPLGSQTGEMIAAWVKEFGESTVEQAVAVSRSFLIKPESLRKGLEERLFNKE